MILPKSTIRSLKFHFSLPLNHILHLKVLKSHSSNGDQLRRVCTFLGRYFERICGCCVVNRLQDCGGGVGKIQCKKSSGSSLPSPNGI